MSGEPTTTSFLRKQRIKRTVFLAFPAPLLFSCLLLSFSQLTRAQDIPTQAQQTFPTQEPVFPIDEIPRELDRLPQEQTVTDRELLRVQQLLRDRTGQLQEANENLRAVQQDLNRVREERDDSVQSLNEEIELRQSAEEARERALQVLSEEREGRQSAEQERDRALQDLSEERDGRQSAEQERDRALQDLSEERDGRQSAEQERNRALQDLAEEREGRQSAERDRERALQALEDAEERIRDLMNGEIVSSRTVYFLIAIIIALLGLLAYSTYRRMTGDKRGHIPDFKLEPKTDDGVQTTDKHKHTYEGFKFGIAVVPDEGNQKIIANKSIVKTTK